tara:strand:- start:14967 stop:15194 length:228 start_codon:yes stop_codon:yes gene_type:complete
MRKKTPEEIRAGVARKADMFKRFFNSADGEEILQALEEEFNHDQIVVPQDPHMTHYKLGQRDVVVYIRQLLRYEQ